MKSIHRTYRLSRLITFLSACWKGRELARQYLTLDSLVAWINRDPAAFHDGLVGTRVGTVVWLRQALNAALGLPTIEGFTPGNPNVYGLDSPFRCALDRRLPVSPEEVEELKRDAMIVMDREGLYEDRVRTYDLGQLLEHAGACQYWRDFIKQFRTEEELVAAITPELRVPSTALALAYDNLRWFAGEMALRLGDCEERNAWIDRRSVSWEVGGIPLTADDLRAFKALWIRYANHFSLFTEE